MPFSPSTGTSKKTVFKFVIVAVIAGPAFIFLSRSVTAPIVRTNDSEIRIKGDDECQSKTKAALAVLQAGAPEYYAEVKKYVGVIECVSEGSGMYAEEDPPRFVVGNETRDSSTLWYAGAIVHDANHSKLYNDYKNEHPGEAVPGDVWTGRAAESECIDAQYNAIKQLGADADTLKYLQSTLGTNYWEDQDRKW